MIQTQSQNEEIRQFEYKVGCEVRRKFDFEFWNEVGNEVCDKVRSRVRRKVRRKVGDD